MLLLLIFFVLVFVTYILARRQPVVALDPESLAQYNVFDADVLVFGSLEDDANIILGKHARSLGLERVIVRIEDPDKQFQVQNEDIAVFSTLHSSRILLKALIEYPSAVQLLTQHDNSIHEIRMDNPAYHQMNLRKLPLLGNVLILRIYRGDSFIIPHGNTAVQLGDRLLASGQPEQIHALKQQLE